jgi:2-methylaconitate cis-trans-isomerase PrpF
MAAVALKGSSSSALVRLVFQSYADADADGQQLPTANLYQVLDANNADIATTIGVSMLFSAMGRALRARIRC